MQKFNYLIIGNSAGAVGCIEGLRTVDKNGTIAVVSEESHHVYSRALIPYYLDGKVNKENMHYRPQDFYQRAGVTLFSGQRASEVHFDTKEVVMAGGERLGYEKLLLATGGKPIVPPIPGLDKSNVFTFLSMDDVLKIEKSLAGAKDAVVLGGGVIGLMAAEVLKKKGLNVHVLELAPRVLAPVIDETASDIVESSFKEVGVEIATNNTIQEIHGQETVDKIVLKDGTVLSCDLLVVGVGVSPRVDLVANTAIKIERGIVVDQKMQTSVPDVYACGDCASIYDFITGENRPLPLWPNAYSGGRVAAFNMAGKSRYYTWGTGMNSMHFFDTNIINAGMNVSEENDQNLEIITKVEKEKRIYRKFVINEQGHIKGFALIGEVARAGILLNLIRSKVDVRPFKQKLLEEDFGYAHMHEELRWQLLKDDVVLGVI
ncbi:MAG: NAD(P)/FAD-dependent oxidoreductase [Firmicutes bacterium]|nr:NAD(P)/FAD-dependent oxidoreductase [Bacillota bacterium]